jgi:uncharacterized membrane protein YgcG
MKKHRLINPQSQLMVAAMSLSGLVAGCNASANTLVQPVNAQEPIVPPTLAPLPTLPPAPTATPFPTNTPSPTPWFTPTPLPTATPWSAPAAWRPASLEIPTLQPLPVVTAAVASGAVAQGVLPVSYSPPDGVDVFGGGLLRWEFYGNLAEDEWFDVKIRPVGSNDSVFVDWTKEKEYPLGPWSGWQPGLYTWQIGIVQGYKEGDTKHFIADTGRNTQPYLIKWQAAGGGGGGGSTGGGGGGGGGGGNSGGS